MIIVYAPLKRDYIIALLHLHTFDSITFEFVKRDDMKLYFSYTGDSEDQALRAAKSAIKKSKFGSALYFTVTSDTNSY